MLEACRLNHNLTINAVHIRIDASLCDKKTVDLIEN